MKLSTLTTDLGLIIDYSKTNNRELYDSILSELNNSGSHKDIRKVTIVRLILTEFMTNLKFQAMFDYNKVELKEVLSTLNKRETYLIIWNAICDITDITEFEYNLPAVEDDIVLQSSMNNQQTVQQAVQQAKSEGSYKTRKETDAQTARRMNISVPELLTLRGLKEKDRLSLKKEMNTKDKAGKNAKTKVVKFVTFNENFDKGFVSLEYPKLKGWLPISMGASEFFRKTNTKVRKLTAAEAKAQQVKQQVKQQVSTTEEAPTAIWKTINNEEVSFELEDLWSDILDRWSEFDIYDEIFGSSIPLGDDWSDLSDYEKEKFYNYLLKNIDNPEFAEIFDNETKEQQVNQQVSDDYEEMNKKLDAIDKEEDEDDEYYGDFPNDEDDEDFDENSWVEMNTTKGFENLSDEDEDDFVDYGDNTKKGFENPYSLEGYGGTDDLSSDSGTNPTLNTQQILTQQFIQQAVQQAQANGQIITPKVIKEETEAAKARRMNITVPQMKTLMAIKEKDRLTLKTPMSTKDKSGKNAKTKVMKFISFNPKFDKGMVFLEYPHLKGWLVTSMGASEFFRKFNVRLKSIS